MADRDRDRDMNDETTTSSNNDDNVNTDINNNNINNDININNEDLEEERAWGTLEELLLVCSVNRYGTNSWDSIATELHNQRRRFISSGGGDGGGEEEPFSAHNCRMKYVDLKRRFNAAGEKVDAATDEEENELLRIVEELRKLRVEQLKSEVHKHDVSIVSLENKVKRLEEERENNNNNSSLLVKPELQKPPQNRSDEPKSDLRNEQGKTTTKTGDHDGEPERSSGEEKRDSAGDWSVNESNSNNNKREDPVVKRASRLGDSASESKRYDSIKQQQSSGDVQSSASLSKKKRRRLRGGSITISSTSGGGGGDESESPANKRINVKSQPLIRFLDSLRSHKHGSVFQRRLPSQETEKFRTVVRQHMDLDTVQSRLDRGLYCECHPKFYRDLLLIFTNAVQFYRKSSAEHIAARELRRIVMEEITLRTPKPIIQPVKPDPETQLLEPVMKKPRSSTTMVVCRRRSAMQGLPENMKPEEDPHIISSIKTSNIGTSREENGREDKSISEQFHKKVDGSSNKSSSNTFVGRKEKEGDKGSEDSTLKKSLTGGRGTLRLNNNNGKKIISKEGNKREKLAKEENLVSEGDEPIEKKKVNVDSKQEKATNVLKKQGVANFLKRMKQNSPSSQEKAKNNDSDEEEEEEGDHVNEGPRVGKREKKDIISNNNSKKTGGNSKKSHNSRNNKDVDIVVTRRSSGRRGEKEAIASTRAIGRPPKRKAAMVGGGTPDSAKGGRSNGRNDGEKAKKKPRR